MAETLGSQASSQIDFEVTESLEKNNPTAEFLNIFVGRSFPVEAHRILQRESVGEEGADVVCIGMTAIRERLVATSDGEALCGLQGFRAWQVTGAFFPVSMGRFVDRASGQAIKIENILAS